MEVWLNGSQYRLVTPCGTGSNPVISASSLTTDIVQNMDARREGKLRKKAPTEYETTPVFFSGSNPDASTKFGTIFEILKIIGEFVQWSKTPDC